jgi:nucleoside-diphosphate kinase
MRSCAVLLRAGRGDLQDLLKLAPTTLCTRESQAFVSQAAVSEQLERTLVLVKPDGVRRGLAGEVIRRIEAKGYRLVALDLRTPDSALLAEHYAEHEGKPFYAPLVEFMRSGPVVALVVEGQRVVEGFRSLAGATDPTVAAPGTIRGDLGRDWGLAVQQNLVHGSDSPESAAREIGLWFPSL